MLAMAFDLQAPNWMGKEKILIYQLILVIKTTKQGFIH